MAACVAKASHLGAYERLCGVCGCLGLKSDRTKLRHKDAEGGKLLFAIIHTHT